MRVPFALAIVVGALLFSRGSAAQAPPVTAPMRAMTAKSRQLFNDGLTAYSQHRWEDAYAAFLASWALTNHYSIEGNLAECEMKLGRARDAAEHFAHYARELAKDPERTPAELADGEARFARAREKVGIVSVHVNQPGSKIYVDGKFIGTDPLEYPVFIEPGDHGIDARSEGLPPGHAAINARAGVTQDVTLTLGHSDQPSPPVPRSSGSRLGLGWVVATGVVAAAGIGTGIGFTVAANGKGSDASTLGAGLVPSACFGSAGGSATCTAVRSAVQDKSTLFDAAAVSFIGGGVFALAAGGLWFWSTTTPRASDDQKIAVHVLPVVGAQDIGFTVIGAW